MKNFALGVVVTVIVLVVGGLAYLRLGFAEIRADIAPSRWERTLMYSAAHASVRRRAPEQSNPVPATDENLIAGGRIYFSECSGCHGTPGKQDPTPNSLYPPVPELPVVGTTYTEAQIFFVAKHGVRMSGMFANGMWDSDQRLWTVAAFIKRIKELPPHVVEELAKPEVKK